MEKFPAGSTRVGMWKKYLFDYFSKEDKYFSISQKKIPRGCILNIKKSTLDEPLK